jgi:hypothetical protein
MEHQIEEYKEFCSCGSDTYVCQICGGIKCPTAEPEMRVGIHISTDLYNHQSRRIAMPGEEVNFKGNVCPTCIKLNSMKTPRTETYGEMMERKLKQYTLILGCLKNHLGANTRTLFANCSGCDDQAVCHNCIDGLRYNYNLAIEIWERKNGRK